MSSKIGILEPGAGERSAANGKLTALASLSGAVVGFIDNTKPNFNHLIDDLAEVLVEKHGVREVIKRGKRVQSIPAPDSVIEELTARCDLVIAGSGD